VRWPVYTSAEIFGAVKRSAFELWYGTLVLYTRYYKTSRVQHVNNEKHHTKRRMSHDRRS
jgi:hypothetical protein